MPTDVLVLIIRGCIKNSNVNDSRCSMQLIHKKMLLEHRKSKKNRTGEFFFELSQLYDDIWNGNNKDERMHKILGRT